MDETAIASEVGFTRAREYRIYYIYSDEHDDERLLTIEIITTSGKENRWYFKDRYSQGVEK